MRGEELQVIHVITTIERGGAENAVLALAQEQVRNGYYVVVVPLKGSLELANDFIAAGVIVDTSLLSHSFIGQVKIFRKKYAENSIFHGHLPRSESLLRFCKSKRFFFVTRHNAEKFFPSAPDFFSRMLSRFVTQKSHSVIAISYAVAQFLSSSREISRFSQVSVIYYGYSRRINCEEKQNIVKPLNQSVLRIGTISRLAPQKNLQLLIELGSKLKSSQQDFKIRIVGAGPDKLQLQKRIEELDLHDDILLLGRQSDVMPFLQAQDVFVLTSNYEGFGLVLLEAMDAGLPIVAARNSSIPEVLGDTHPGLFRTGDSESLLNTMNSVLHNSDTYDELMMIQSRQLKFFSMAQYFMRHHELYTRSLAGRR